MADFTFTTEAAPHIAHAVKHVVHHAAPTMAAVSPVIKQGFSMLTLFLSSMTSMGIGFGLGWYIKGRGMTGVQIDLNNIKADVENLKAKFSTPVAVTATAG